MTRRILLAAVTSILFSLPLFAAAAPVATAAPAKPKILVHGHRGCRAIMPENTLAAFNEALRVGVDVLETDMQVTKDDVIILAHDKELNPEHCLGPDGKAPAAGIAFRSLTLEQVKQYDCGTLKHPLFPTQNTRPGEKIPTLKELFELVKTSTYPAAATVQFNIETKIEPGKPQLSPAPDKFSALVYDMVKQYGYEDRVILQSFDKRTLVAMKKLEPRIRLAMLTSDNNLPFVAVAQAIGAQIISPNGYWITPADIKELHAAGVQVVPWTINEPAAWDLLIAFGTDAIITDNPGALIEHLKAKGLR